MEEYCIMQDCVDYIALKWSDFCQFPNIRTHEWSVWVTASWVVGILTGAQLPGVWVFKTIHLCSDRWISGNNAFKFPLKKRSARAGCREGLKYYAFLPAIVHFKNNARFLPKSVFPQNEDRFVCVRLYLDIAS